MGQKQKKKDVQFEESLKRLEKIVEMLERGNVPLSDSVKLYEEGLSLSKDCLKQLNDAEIKLKKISREIDGAFKTDDLDD